MVVSLTRTVPDLGTVPGCDRWTGARRAHSARCAHCALGAQRAQGAPRLIGGSEGGGGRCWQGRRGQPPVLGLGNGGPCYRVSTRSPLYAVFHSPYSNFRTPVALTYTPRHFAPLDPRYFQNQCCTNIHFRVWSLLLRRR